MLICNSISKHLLSIAITLCLPLTSFAQEQPSNESSAPQEEVVESSLPFQGKKYQTNKKYYRAVGTGSSQSERTATLKARTDAQRKLAEQIQQSVSKKGNVKISSSSVTLREAAEKDFELYVEEDTINWITTYHAHVVLEVEKKKVEELFD
ncbi:hypothetical protein [Algivirga pacifica]|uniref:LPP20 lipoprotein n=1 Tax=Algivirga pacifica TaxID=1162670 RepID=A0ABP9D381_9BACT